MNQWIQLVYLPMALIAVAGYGWAILETRLLPRWVGWFTAVWSLGWLLLVPVGAPPVVVFAPLLVIGAVLLVIG